MSDRRGWTIRSGAEADAPAILALWLRAGAPPSATDTEDALRGLLGRDPDSLLLAEADGEIVASLIAGWDGWRGSFYRLAVDPRWRRKGLATALVRCGEDRLRSLGAVRLTAIVIANDRDAMNLWRAVGYERQAGVGRFVRMLGD